MGGCIECTSPTLSPAQTLVVLLLLIALPGIVLLLIITLVTGDARVQTTVKTAWHTRVKRSTPLFPSTGINRHPNHFEKIAAQRLERMTSEEGSRGMKKDAGAVQDKPHIGLDEDDIKLIKAYVRALGAGLSL